MRLAIQFSGLGILAFGFWLGVIPGQSHKTEEDVGRFLTGYVEARHMDADNSSFSMGAVDLNGDGLDEIIVYLRGRDWCGTAGCQTLVLSQSSGVFRVVGRILATRPPIRALDQKVRGWRTLTAWVRGSDANEFEAEFPFNGKTYPVAAAKGVTSSVKSKSKGQVVIPLSAEEFSLRHVSTQR